jgi:hypothetical protein
VLTRIISNRVIVPLVVSCSLVGAVAGCNRNSDSVGSADSSQGSTTVASGTAVQNPNAPIMVRGSVVSVSPEQLVVNADTGSVSVTIVQPFRLYTRVPTTMSQVKENSFIGVTTVKQPDGSERASEIHVFPEELRGVGEGSRMMAPNAGANASRMTNGNVSTSRMTNGAVSQSRMSNGNVSSTNGSTLVVQYAGGSQNGTVPPNTPVTELKLTSRKIAAGDQVAVLAKKNPDGTLTADKAISTTR